jgi:hypothetical protein
MYWYCCGQLWNLYQTNKLDMKARKKKPTVWIKMCTRTSFMSRGRFKADKYSGIKRIIYNILLRWAQSSLGDCNIFWGFMTSADQIDEMCYGLWNLTVWVISKW